MKKLIILLIILMSVSAFAQDTTYTRIAIGLNMQDVYDAIAGNDDLGAAIQVAPIIPIKPSEGTILHDLYFIPFIRGGKQNTWTASAGGGTVYDFGDYYLRYNAQLFEVNESEDIKAELAHEFGMGISLQTVTKWSFFYDWYIDMYYRYNTEMDSNNQRDELMISIVKVL